MSGLAWTIDLRTSTQTCKSCLDRPKSRKHLVLVSVRPNPNLYPDGGYLFVEGDGTKFRGESWKNLISKVRDYRQRNKRPAGDPESEIFSQYCSRMPSHCKNMSTGPVVIQGSHSISLNQRVLQFIANLLEWKRKAAIPRVADSVAAERAAVCAACPHNKPLVQTCQTCVKSVAHGRKVVLDGAASHHQGLLACDVLGEDLPLTVHIEQPKVPEGRVPPYCWRK